MYRYSTTKMIFYMRLFNRRLHSKTSLITFRNIVAYKPPPKNTFLTVVLFTKSFQKM